MRFLFYTDLHLSGMAPRHRVDDYTEALLAKLVETYRIAEDRGCDFLVCGGDFFDFYKVYSYDMIGRAMDVICQSPLETFLAIGQHDIYGYNPKTFKLSTLNFVVRNCARLHVMWEPVTIGEVTIYPSHVWDDVRQPPAFSPVKGHCNILVAHHLLSRRSAPYEVVLTSSLVPSPYDLVLSGDLHSGFETHEIDGTTFCNPGSLARRTVSEVGRWPQVAVIDVEGNEVSVDIKRLSCPKDGLEVFGETLAEAARDEARLELFDASSFVDGVERFESESVDIFELVLKVGGQKHLSPEVLNYILSKKNEN